MSCSGWWPNWLVGLSDEAAGIRAGREILRTLTPSGLARFDSELHGRSWTAPAWFQALWKVKPQHVERLAKISEDEEATAVILAAHPSGWVRQAALPLLEKCATPLALGMLVLRSNDWVDAIRGEAQQRLRMIAQGSVVCLVPVLPLLEQLAKEASRSSDFAAEVLGLVTAHAPREALVRGLASPDRRVRRSIARLLVRTGLPPAALDAAMDQDDAVTACLIAEAAAARDVSPELTNRLMAAPIPRLRRMALLRLLDGGGAPATAAATKALMDPNGHVRSRAQDYLTRTGGEVRRLYADQLDSRPALAILGLAETGSVNHMDRIVAYVSHPSAKVRDAVCYAIAALDVHGRRDALLRCVSSKMRHGRLGITERRSGSRLPSWAG